MIENISVRKTNTIAGNITIGRYKAGSPEEFSVTITHATTASGDIIITLHTASPVYIAITPADTISDIVAKIAAATYPEYTTAVEEDTNTIMWTAKAPGVKTGPISITGPAGFAKSGPTIYVEGTDATVLGQTVMSTALPATAGEIASLPIAKNMYAEDTQIYIGVSSAATGDLALCLQKLF